MAENAYILRVLKRLQDRVADTARRLPTAREGVVTAVDPAGSFTFTVPGSDDLTIDAPPKLLPQVGQTVTVPVYGATPKYVPSDISAGAVTTRELDSGVNNSITTALTTANGKNQVTYSTSAASGSGTRAGDVWFQRSATTGVISGSWEWDGTAWQVRTFGDQVLSSLTAGKITAGTINASLLISGSLATAVSGQRSAMTATGFQAYDTTGTLTVDINGVSNLMTGTVQTALTGRRIKMGASGGVGVINFIAPDGTVTELGSFGNGVGGAENIRMGVPTSGVSQFWNKHQIQGDGSTFSWSAANKIVVGGNGPESAKGFTLSYATSRGTSTDNTIPDVTRIYVDSGSTMLYDPTTGVGRLRVDANALTTYGNDGRNMIYNWGLGQLDINNGTNVFTRIDQFNQVTFSLGTGKGRIEVGNDGDIHSSPRLRFITGSNLGNMFRAFDTGTDIVTQHMEWTTASWRSIAAAGFIVSSDAGQKQEITDFTGPALEHVRGTKVHQYRRKQAPLQKGEAPRTARLEIGLIAQEAPPQIVVGKDEYAGVDLYQAVALLWRAVQELADGSTA